MLIPRIITKKTTQIYIEKKKIKMDTRKQLVNTKEGRNKTEQEDKLKRKIISYKAN